MQRLPDVYRSAKNSYDCVAMIVPLFLFIDRHSVKSIADSKYNNIIGNIYTFILYLTCNCIYVTADSHCELFSFEIDETPMPIVVTKLIEKDKASNIYSQIFYIKKDYFTTSYI